MRSIKSIYNCNKNFTRWVTFLEKVGPILGGGGGEGLGAAREGKRIFKKAPSSVWG